MDNTINNTDTNINNIFSDEIFTYNITEEKDKFVDNFNTQIQKVKSDFYVKNVDEMNNFIKIVEDRKQYLEDQLNNPLNIPGGMPVQIPPLWYDNNNLQNNVTSLKTNFNELIDPAINTKLAESNIVQANLFKLKDVLQLPSIPSFEQLSNLVDFPAEYDFNQLKSMLSAPNLEIPNIDSIKSLLNISTELNIPSLNASIPAISNLTSGLNFNRIVSSTVKSVMTVFPEETPWEQVVKIQSQASVSALFKELSNMTFYIEPGEIKVTTAGSAATQKGVNTNKIKIKLK